MVPPIVIGAHPKRQEPEPMELGLMLSRLTRAPIDVVGTFWFDATPQRTASQDYEQAMRDEIERTLERAVGDLDRACGEVRIHARTGSAAHALHDTASQFGAGLIVVGSTHRGALGRITLGSTTDKVLTGAPCPVAVVPRGFRDRGTAPRRVGVAYVNTPGGEAALRAGAAIARRTGAELIAYTVVEAHAHEADRELAVESVERAIAEHAHGGDGRPLILTDGGVDALVRESSGLDFLLRGARARGPVRPPLALGVPDKLTRQAECPFVVVPPGREEPLVSLFDAQSAEDRVELMSS